jgi:hypothetical protein
MTDRETRKEILKTRISECEESLGRVLNLMFLHNPKYRETKKILAPKIVDDVSNARRSNGAYYPPTIADKKGQTHEIPLPTVKFVLNHWSEMKKGAAKHWNYFACHSGPKGFHKGNAEEFKDNNDGLKNAALGMIDSVNEITDIVVAVGVPSERISTRTRLLGNGKRAE